MPDLMAALEASIAAAKSPGGRKPAARKTPAAAKTSNGRKAANGSAKAKSGPPRAARRPRSSRAVPPARRVQVEVEGRTLSLSNLDKVLYPQAGFTKGAGDRLLHARRPRAAAAPARPSAHAEALSRRRRGAVLLREAVPLAPAGLGADRAVPTGRKTIDFCLCNDLPTLVWMANLADLELHPSLSRGRGHRAADGDGLRPRSRRRPRVWPSAARWRSCCASRWRARARVVPEDLRLEGPPGLRAAQPRRGDLRRDQAARQRARAPSWRSSTRS